MRFHLDDARRHRRVTKALPRLMREAGVDIGHTAAADLAARLFGYADRNELDACLGRSPASRWDEDEAASVVAARRIRQAEVLASAGLPAAGVAAILDAVRPTARAMTGKAPAAGITAAPVADAMKARSGGIDAVLDAWELAAGVDAPALVGRFVREAYDGGFDRVDIRIHRDGHTYGVETVSYDGRSDVYRGPGHEGALVMEWLGKFPAGTTVSHGGLRIPVTIACVSKSLATLGLLVSKRVPAPGLEAYGIDHLDAWLAAVSGRVGVHLMCCPKGFRDYPREGYGRLAESLSDALASLPVAVHDRMSGGDAIRICRPGNGDVYTMAPEILQAPIADGPPANIMMLSEFGASAPALPDIVAAGSSVIYLVRDRPEIVLRKLLSDGLPAYWLRRALLTTSYRIDEPDPHSPATKLGLHETKGMRWEVEVR